MKTLGIGVVGLMAVSLPALAGTPTNWVTPIDAATYRGSTGTITFNDWGYSGPLGVGANDFQVGSGFDASRIGQVQRVVTASPDWRTRDPSYTFSADFGMPGVPPGTQFPNANVDGQVNFFQWGYTTPPGSTFSNMQIDKAGNYHIAKSDMSFNFYDQLQYNNGSTVQTLDTGINFQPYAISDAQGWCGSVLVSNPNSIVPMAGQVTFDFAFDVYLGDGNLGGAFSTQIVPGFIMRSYGDYVVDVTLSYGVNQHFVGSAVVNNTDPLTGLPDPAFQNKVSFLGAGVLPDGVWVLNDGTPDVQVVPEGTPGATWHSNSFAGFAFLLRADADRTLEWIAPDGHSDYVPAVVPLPGAAWLLGYGLIGLVGLVRRPRAG